MEGVAYIVVTAMGAENLCVVVPPFFFSLSIEELVSGTSTSSLFSVMLYLAPLVLILEYLTLHTVQ